MKPIIRWFIKDKLKLRLHALRPNATPEAFHPECLLVTLAPVVNGMVLAEKPVWKLWLSIDSIEIHAGLLVGTGWQETDWKFNVLQVQPKAICPKAATPDPAPEQEARPYDLTRKTPAEKLAFQTEGYALRADRLRLDPSNKCLRKDLTSRKAAIKRLIKDFGLDMPTLPEPEHLKAGRPRRVVS